jgi:hypothetical protein
LQPERIHRLDEIEFPWESIKQASWILHAKSLMQFIKKFNHCNVPERYTPDPQLKGWIYSQRFAYQQGKLSTEKIRYLDTIGFEWAPKAKDRAWESAYFQLQQFKKDYGHCNVPFNYKSNPMLGHWISNQRQFYHKKN